MSLSSEIVTGLFLLFMAGTLSVILSFLYRKIKRAGKNELRLYINKPEADYDVQMILQKINDYDNGDIRNY